MTDLDSGLMDPRLLRVLDLACARHSLHIGMVKTGHPMGAYSPAGRINSHHFHGAVDILAVDGHRVDARPVPGPVIELGELLLTWPAELRPDEVMGPAEWHAALGGGGARTGFRDDEHANSVHADHLHLGFKPGTEE